MSLLSAINELVLSVDSAALSEIDNCSSAPHRPIVLRHQRTQTRSSALIDIRIAVVHNRPMALYRAALTITLRFTTSHADKNILNNNLLTC